MMNLGRSVILILALAIGTVSLPAADSPAPDAVKKRMKANLPAIDKLKKQGKIGENNQAYLEPRVDLTDEEKALVKTENDDRKTVYQLLAERAKTSLEAMQKARAKQIRARSAAGVWLQQEDDEWYRKTTPPSETDQQEDDLEE
jgi:uncharacterized protein YdbL (DUF1318 family)